MSCNLNCSQGRRCDCAPLQSRVGGERITDGEAEPFTYSEFSEWLADMTAPIVVALVLLLVLGIPLAVHVLLQLFHRTTS